MRTALVPGLTLFAHPVGNPTLSPVSLFLMLFLACSGQCFEYVCTSPTVSPGLRKRADIPTQRIVKRLLCPKGFEPCPVFGGGYEVS